MIKYTYKKRQIIVPNGLGNFEGNCVSSGCDLQSKTVTQSTANAVYTPDDGYDGFSRLTVNATQYGNSRFDAGVSSGVTHQKSLLSSTAITENGEYTSENGFSAVTVNVECGSCNLQNKSVSQSEASATYTADTERPTAPNGETVYGGVISALTSIIDANSSINLFCWDNEGHTDSTQIGYFIYSGDSYVWKDAQNNIVYPLDEIPQGWTEVGNAYGCSIYMKNDGMNIFFYHTFTYGMYDRITSSTLDFLILDMFTFDGLNEITVDATQYGDTRYASGYTDGYSSGNTDGYESGITYQKSLLSGITITENGTYTNENGYSAVTVNVQPGDRVAYSLKAVATANTSFSTYLSYNYEEMRINGVSMDFETFTGTTLTSGQTYDVYIVCTNGPDLNFRGRITEMTAVGEANSILSSVDTYNKFTGSSFKILGFPKALGEISIVGGGLTSIEIPESVETIYERAFYGSDNISTIYSHSKNLVMGRDQDVASTGTIHYPSGADYSNVLSVLGSGWTGIADL